MEGLPRRVPAVHGPGRSPGSSSPAARGTGRYWALQAWQRLLPNLGYTPWKHPQAAWELHVSHWRGPLPLLEIWLDWVRDGRFEHLFGRYTYRGKPVFGMSSTPQGVPLDAYGRNVYLDTFDSVYGPGWERENSFLTHEPNGNFCYGFYRIRRRPGTRRGRTSRRASGRSTARRSSGPGSRPT